MWISICFFQQQNLYIRKIEEQPAVCGKKNKAQERLIERFYQILDLFAGDLSNMKAEKEKGRKRPETV